MIPTNTNNRSEAVGVAAVRVAEAQLTSRRSFISFINTSTGGQVITLACGQEAVAGKGFVMSPGGYYTESKDGEDSYPAQEEFTAISDLAGGTLAVVERTERGE